MKKTAIPKCKNPASAYQREVCYDCPHCLECAGKAVEKAEEKLREGRIK